MFFNYKCCYLIRNLPMSFMKNQIATERFKSTVRDKDIIKNVLPTPDWEESFPAIEIDSSFIRKGYLLFILTLADESFSFLIYWHKYILKIENKNYY